MVALQLIAEFMPSSRSADAGFRFDRGVMTEVLVVVHEPTRNMLIEIQIVYGAATAGQPWLKKVLGKVVRWPALRICG